MHRKIIQRLKQWQQSTASHRLPLLLYGARQVGKTFILTDFAKKNYLNFVYINFEINPQYQSFFDGDISPEKIFRSIEIMNGEKIHPQKTLIFLDEIQACERALTFLKYVAEQAPEYHVVAAGSLLGVAVNRERYSFPVGKVQMETLYPLDFEEFLWALGQKKLADEIRECGEKNAPLASVLHERALEFFYAYLWVGGMPAAVLEHQKQSLPAAVSDIHHGILNAYIADMAKYASSAETVKIRTAFNSIPVQLAKENKKFQYKLLKSGASASHFGASIDWLIHSGLVIQCNRVEHGYSPLATQKDLSCFKLYMADTGLLSHKAGVSPRIMIEKAPSNQNFKGALIENVVAQALCSLGYEVFYWESSSQAEIDFVISLKGESIPIEVKAAENVRSKSLGVYIKKYEPQYAIRISSRNFGFENGLRSIPLYAVFTIA